MKQAVKDGRQTLWHIHGKFNIPLSRIPGQIKGRISGGSHYSLVNKILFQMLMEILSFADL